MDTLVQSINSSEISIFCVKALVIFVVCIIGYIIRRYANKALKIMENHDHVITGIIDTLRNHSEILTSLVEKTKDLGSFNTRLTTLEKAVTKLTSTIENLTDVINRDYVKKEDCLERRTNIKESISKLNKE